MSVIIETETNSEKYYYQVRTLQEIIIKSLKIKVYC